MSLDPLFTEKLQFNDFFDMQFDDYNGDGNIDFAIGQYGTSNGNYFKLFSLTKENQLIQLSVKGVDDLFISGGKGSRYSVKLDKVGANGFKKSYYDNASGETKEDVFVWDGHEFIKA